MPSEDLSARRLVRNNSATDVAGDLAAPLFSCLVRGICGSLIRSNGTGKVGSRSRRPKCRWGVGLFRSQLPFEPVWTPRPNHHARAAL